MLLPPVAASNFPTMNGNAMQKSLKSIILLLVLVCLILSGCAPITDGESKDSVSATTTDSVVDTTSTADASSGTTTTGDPLTTSSVDKSEGSTKTDGGSGATKKTSKTEVTVSKDSSYEDLSSTDETTSTESDDKTDKKDPTTSTDITSKTDETVSKEAIDGIVLPDDEW